jgi:hypothetical protein
MRKVFVGLGAFILILVIVVFFLMMLARNAPAPQIAANFTQLDKIEKISKFRSCAGHTTVPQDQREMKRSMKHYFWVKPQHLGGDTVEIHSPYDGFVSVVRKDPTDGLEGEIWISPKNIFGLLPPFGMWIFSVQHINVRDGLNQGSEVKAGDLIGHAAVAADNRNTFDIVYAKGSPTVKRIDNWMGPFVDLDSVFNHMSDEVFAQYQEKGIAAKEDLIISKEERDQNPCIYKDNGPYFLNQEDENNWVLLKD